MPVGNGLFDFASKRLIPFTPDLVFTWKSPIDFDLAAAEFAVKRDGTAIIAKSNDYQAVWPNYVEVTERAEDEPGRTMPIDNGKTVLAPLPDTLPHLKRKPNPNSNTLKNGRNPETGEVLDELRELKPLQVKLDSSVYALSSPEEE